MKKYLFLMAVLISGMNTMAETKIGGTKLDETVISTENFETTVKQTAANITIVTAEEIEKKGATDLVDALRMVPGIMVKNYYGNITFDIGGYSSVHAERNTIITYDGVKISGEQATSIPIEMIERVEVIPNGGGILYGNGAAGGIINILSKNIYSSENKKDYYGLLKLQTGIKDSYKYGITAGAKVTKKFDLKVDYLRSRDNNWRDDDKYGKLISRQEEINVDGHYKFTDSDLKVKYTRNERHGADGGDLPEKYYKENRKQTLYGSRWHSKSNDWYANYRKSIGENTEFLVYANYYEKENLHVRRGYKTGEYERYYVKSQVKQNYLDNNYFIVGVDYFEETDKSMSKGKKTGRNSIKKEYGVFIKNEIRFGKLTFDQGARYNTSKYDYYWKNQKPIPEDKRGEKGEQEYDNYALNFDLKYDYSNTGMTYLKLERSFRTPLIREMNYTVNASKLDSQIQHLVEIGVKDSIGNTYVSASAFYKETKGEIYYQGTYIKEDDYDYFPYYNMGDTRRIGVEILAEQYVNKLVFTETLTYLHHKIIESNFQSRKNKEIPMVPNWKLGLGVGYEYSENLNFNIDGVYYGKYYDSDDPENIRKKDCGNYITVDFSAVYKIGDITLTGRINNLFDEEYEDYVGYWDGTRQYSPAQGRSYTLGITYKF